MNDYAVTNFAVQTDDDITRLFFEKNGDAVAATDRKYGRLFYSISLGILGNAEDARECVNDTYMKLWSTIPPERPRSLRAYGARIVKNLSINRAEYNSAACRGGGEILAELDESVPDEGGSPFEEGEISALIDSFLRGIDRESRVAFVLRYWYCTPLEGIAKQLGSTVPTVKSRLFRTRKKLKSYLMKEGISL